MEQGKTLKVAIVGGGPGCKAVMDMIFAEKLSQLRMKLIGVASTNPKAVGCLYAKEKGIYTTEDYHDLYKLKDLNMIIELTGREEVANEISHSKPDHVRLMDHVAAHLFWDVFQIEEHGIAERRRAEKALQKAHDELEQRVEDRTAMLAKTTEQLTLELTERKRAVAALRKSEETLRSINVELAEGLSEVFNALNQISSGNPEVRIPETSELELISKLKHMVNMTAENLGEIVDLSHEFAIGLAEHFDVLDRVSKGDLSARVSGASQVDLLESLKNVTNHMIESVSREIAERKRAEEKLRNAQDELIRGEKLAILGQMAGGVGHELRNPLGAIKNAVYFLNMALEEPEPEIKETLGILENEVLTSERIISSLLGFARSKPPVRRKVGVKDCIQEALSRVIVPDKVDVASQFDETLPTILVDPDQLLQAFVNILLNAIQAMPEGGKLVLGAEVQHGAWMTVSFSDTGVGIPKENLAKLFEPLFTTKAKGIGLGMAITKTLVEGNGGTIEVHSEVGKGSTFTVKLPVLRGEERRNERKI
jgi:C4-dicarboxylate-specific signal transduction histidine kinase